MDVEFSILIRFDISRKRMDISIFRYRSYTKLKVCLFLEPAEVVVVNMAAKHRFPGGQVWKIGRCRISADCLEVDKLEFSADVAARVDYCARHYDDFRQIAGDSDSDKVTVYKHFSSSSSSVIVGVGKASIPTS